MAKIIIPNHLREEIKLYFTKEYPNQYEWVCDFCKSINLNDIKQHPETKDIKVYPEELCYFIFSALRHIQFIRRVTIFHPTHLYPLIDKLLDDFADFEINNFINSEERPNIEVAQKLYIGLTMAIVVQILRILNYEYDSLSISEMLSILNKHKIASPYTFIKPLSCRFHTEKDSDCDALSDFQHIMVIQDEVLHLHIRNLCALTSAFRRYRDIEKNEKSPQNKKEALKDLVSAVIAEQLKPISERLSKVESEPRVKIEKLIGSATGDIKKMQIEQSKYEPTLQPQLEP